MEANRLNLNRPLLSVRRHSSNVASAEDDDRRINDYISVTPQIPHYRSELKSGPVRNPGVVPFQWEQSPGKPKEAVRTTIENSLENVGNIHTTAIEGVKENKDGRKTTSKSANEDGDGGGEEDDDDVAYVDALDTLSSRTESTLLNCSLSGLSAFENSDANKPRGISSRDPQMLNLVMDRFLPAAKAMVQCDTPQYNIPKKPMVTREQSHDEAKTIVAVRKDKPLLRYGPSFANLYSHYHVSEEQDEDEEEEDSDDDYRGHGNLPPICGLLPRFCLKGSIGLVSPVSGTSVRTRVPKPRANEVQSRHASTCPNPEMEKEVRPCGLSQRDVRPCSSLNVQGLRDDKDEDNIVLKTLHKDHHHLTDSYSKDLKNSPDPVEPSKEVNRGPTHIDQNTESADSKISDKACSEFVISPPLPKSPSDSWLWRTLPTVVSTRNTSRPFVVGADTKVTKWENIVKSASLQHHK